MIDWYRDYDEINVELRELAAREVAEKEEGTTSLLFIGSGEDICIFQMNERNNGQAVCNLEPQASTILGGGVLGAATSSNRSRSMYAQISDIQILHHRV